MLYGFGERSTVLRDELSIKTRASITHTMDIIVNADGHLHELADIGRRRRMFSISCKANIVLWCATKSHNKFVGKLERLAAEGGRKVLGQVHGVCV